MKPQPVGLMARDYAMGERMESALLDGGYDPLVVTTLDELEDLACDNEIELAAIGCPRPELRRPWQLQAIRRSVPMIHLLVVSQGEGRQVVRDAMGAGADGYVPEDLIEERLAIGVDAILAGYVCVPQSMRRVVVRVAFTHRERQVLTLVRYGLSNQQMAQRLFLSESTIKSHLASGFRKLGVTSRIEAAAMLADPGELEHSLGPAAFQLIRKPSARDADRAPAQLG
jgi:DNA-binding NarL/FixJ family response regulator